MDDPWWITAARVIALVGLSYGAWEGFRRMRIEKRKKAEADKQAPGETLERKDDQ